MQTDGAREQFEKSTGQYQISPTFLRRSDANDLTGKNVPAKFSN